MLNANKNSKGQSILHLLASSFAWSGFANYLVFTFNILLRLVLARQLTSEMFGLYALAISISDVFLLVGVFRFTVTIVQFPQDKGVPKKIWNFIRWQSVISVLMAIPLVGYGYKRGGFSLAMMVAFYIISQVLGYYKSFYQSLLEKDLDYRRGGLGNLLPTVLVGIGVIFLAWRWPSPFVLGIKDPVLVLGALILLWYWVPKFSEKAEGEQSSKNLLKIGGQVFLHSQAVNLFERLDNLLIASIAGLTILGEYSQARYLTISASSMITLSLTPIFSLYANIGNNSALKESLCRFVNFCLFRCAVFPIILMIFFPSFVTRVLLGPGWEGTVQYIRILAPSLLVAGLFTNINTFLHTEGHLGGVVIHLWMRVLYYSLFLLLIYQKGPKAIALSYVFCNFIFLAHLSLMKAGLLKHLIIQMAEGCTYFLLVAVIVESFFMQVPVWVGMLATMVLFYLIRRDWITVKDYLMTFRKGLDLRIL
jgi:O-antigen/teichoic acid export membrane protein